MTPATGPGTPGPTAAPPTDNSGSLLPGLHVRAAQAESPGITVAETTWDYPMLRAAVGGARARLRAHLASTRPQTQPVRLAVWATPTPATVLAVVAGLEAGVEVVPVPPDAGVAEVRHILTDSAVVAWFGASPDDAAGLPVIDLAPTEPSAPDSPAEADLAPAWLPGSAPAILLYTSGTTGLPKGVRLSRGAIAAGLDGLAEAWAWTDADVLAHGLPLFHVHGLILGVIGPLRLGGGLRHVGRPTPAAYADAVGLGATMLFGVPTIWSRIAESEEDALRLRPARLLVSGSAALPVPVFDRLQALTGHAVVERYGMSETLITVATRAEDRPRAGWVGVPIRGVETRLRDDDERPVAHDGTSVGSLEVRGPTVCDGYLNRADADAESWTSDGWFRTGDVAVIDGDGWHRIVGRASTDLIKSGGYRIGAGEIETVLLGHDRVAEVAVVGEPDADLGQRIVAHVVVRGDADPDATLAEELIALVGAELNRHKRPREVRFTATLPRNAMGKVQKKRLLE